jgi:flagellar L-ring protein precursor FlgH
MKAVRFHSLLLVAGMATGLFGCGSVPQSSIGAPLSAKPVQRTVVANNRGAIFHAETFRPLFEDRRPRFVGDILTIAINERTSAGKQSGTSGSKTNSASVSTSQLFGMRASTAGQLGLSGSGALKFEDKGTENASNSFSGTIGVTVSEVLANGNLVVAGEKQIAFDRGVEFVRFYGVVNPDTVAPGNVVASSQVADARFEYRTTSRIDRAEVNNMLSRFFFSVAPL